MTTEDFLRALRLLHTLQPWQRQVLAWLDRHGARRGVHSVLNVPPSEDQR